MFQKLFSLLVLGLLFFSCTNPVVEKYIQTGTSSPADPSGTGNVQFSYSTEAPVSLSLASSISRSKAKESSPVDRARKIVITVKDSANNIVYEKLQVNLLTFGTSGSYLSTPVSFTPGTYQITEYFVADDKDKALMTIPLEGSKLAHLVSDPLPIIFSITKDTTAKVAPQVVDLQKTEYNTPADFGYSTFSFSLVKTFDFQVGVFTYDASTDNLELTEALITVKSGAETLYSGTLAAATNQVFVKDGYANYDVTVTKKGYQDFVKSFTVDALKGYQASPLKITLFSKDYIPRIGLVGEWLFNGNAKDTSGIGSDGTENGGVVYSVDRFGKANNAASFDGIDDYINFPAPNLGLDNFTLSVWIKASSVQTNIRNGIISRNASRNGLKVLQVLSPKAHFEVSYRGVDGPHKSEIHHKQLNDDTYHHIVLQRNTTTKRIYLYVDGQLASEDTRIGEKIMVDYDTFVGKCTYEGVDYPFKGIIDDLRLYSRALSQEEIKMLYHEGGWKDNQSLYTIETLSSMPKGIRNGSVNKKVVNNKIYVFGGYDGTHPFSDRVYEYNTLTDSWTDLGSVLPYGRGNFCNNATVFNNSKIYLAPSSGPQPNNGWGIHSEIIEFDIATSQCSYKTSFPAKRWGIFTVSANNFIYMFGYHDGSDHRNIVKYDPATDKITDLGLLLPYNVTQLNGLLAPNGKIYIMGGQSKGTFYKDIMVFDPSTETLTTIAPNILPFSTFAGNNLCWIKDNIIFLIDESTGKIYEFEINTNNLTLSSFQIHKENIQYFPMVSYDEKTGVVYLIGGSVNGSPGV